MMSGDQLLPVPMANFLHDRGEDGEDDVLDLPSSNKFGFAWPKHSSLAPENLSPYLSSEAEVTSVSESDITHPGRPSLHPEGPTPGYRPGLPGLGQGSFPPRFSRSFSAPLPSQLGYLQNPHRTPSSLLESPPSPLCGQSPGSQFHEISLELADSVQGLIQTLIQVSPHQVLDPVKEQLSACSLSIPTPSVSAMLTSMKNLNYISAHMGTFCAESADNASSDSGSLLPPAQHNDFDIGEMLQCVGDVLSGAAAQVGVGLVLCHGDVHMKRVPVRGDENGISFVLSHVSRKHIDKISAETCEHQVTRQVIHTAQKDDSIQIHLSLAPQTFDISPPSTEPLYASAASIRLEGQLRCTFRITHDFRSSEDTSRESSETLSPSTSLSRPLPALNTLLLRRLLRQVGASLVPDLEADMSNERRSYEVTVVLDRALKTMDAVQINPTSSQSGFGDENFSNEPSLEDLSHFSETLKGQKVILHANLKAAFARHLTSYLTAWGLDVSPVASEGDHESEIPLEDVTAFAVDPLSSPYELRSGGSEFATALPPSLKLDAGCKPRQVSFVIIDDDVAVLGNRLLSLSTERQKVMQPSPYPHRPLRSADAARAPNQSPHQFATIPHEVVLHFTSLSNYKPAKDVIQSTLAISSPAFIPEVMIIPKPAGPRRILTSLYTAVTKPNVDPFFAPIATSPCSPSQNGSFYFNSTSSIRRPSLPHSSPARSARSPKGSSGESASHLPPSPLGLPEASEYFTENQVKLGATPASGLVIQSPDGQPAGIFFHPKAKSTRSFSSVQPIRDLLGPQRATSAPRRASVAIIPSAGEAKPTYNSVLFSSRHDASSPPSSFQGGSVMPPLSDTISTALKEEQTTSPKASSPRDEEYPISSPLRSPALPSPRKVAHQDVISPQTGTPPGSPLKGVPPSVSHIPIRRVAPRRPTQETKASHISSSRAKGKSFADVNVVPPIRVLIVDGSSLISVPVTMLMLRLDNPISQTLLSTWMKKKQIQYDVAMNGLEAVQKWKTGGFHLILVYPFLWTCPSSVKPSLYQMDIQMPVMDGIQSTKEIRRLEKECAAAGYPLMAADDSAAGTSSDSASSESRGPMSPYRSSVIIVALTASSLQSDRVAALAAGCNDFLTKPVSLVWLNNKIIEWGSIKALQMWADLRPDVVKSISTKQVAQARNVAQRLHVPEGRHARPNSSSQPPVSGSKDTSETTTPVASTKKMTKYSGPRGFAKDDSGSSSSTATSTEREARRSDSNEGLHLRHPFEKFQ
jgi:osomolarity two-component system, response regulator SSK1